MDHESSIIDRDWRQDSRVNTTPFTWAFIPGFFSADAVGELMRTFPEEGFTVAGDGSPGFRFNYRPLIRKGSVHGSIRDLHGSWQELVQALRSDAYLSALCDLVSVRRQPQWTIDAGLCIYSAGCALKPHTDRPMRILTQVTYLNDRWDPDWGGALRVLRSERADDVAAEVLPVRNHSVIFVRSAASWHAVMPVTRGNRVRRSVLFHLST